MEARIPPTERWPLRFTRPAAVLSEMKAFSSSASEGMVKGTFIRDRTASSTGQS